MKFSSFSGFRRFRPALLTFMLCWTCAAREGRAGFNPGDILVNEFRGSSIERYDSNGTLLQTFTGMGTYFLGASLTPDGNLVTTYRLGGPGGYGGVNIFDPSGKQISTFTTPFPIQGGGGMSTSADLNVFADGVIAIVNQDGSAIQEYNQDGTFVRTVQFAIGSHVFGSTLGSDNTLYVAGDSSNTIQRVTQSGQILAPLVLSFRPGDLVRAADGTFYVTGFADGLVHHVSATGADLSTFEDAGQVFPFAYFFGIGLATDGQSLYLNSGTATTVDHVSLSGSLLPGSFNLANPNDPLFLTVVPGVISVPEPSSLTLFGIFGALASGFLARKRRLIARSG